jgi:WD40 repeat protein
VAFVPDGERLVTTSNDGTTRVWDVSVGGSRDWLTVPTAYLRFVEVAFSPDGRWFAAPTDAPHGVTIWDTETGAEVMTLTGHEGAPIDVAFSADGSRLAAATFDQTIPVWDLSTGELALTLAGHPGEGARMVAFSPDGARLLSGSYDGTARVWDLSTGDLIAILNRGHGAVGAVAVARGRRRPAPRGPPPPHGRRT